MVLKLINDTHGHDVGDQLLETVGKRLQGVCRRSDTVARLGGDEFAILYANLRDVAELDTFARRVINELSQPMNLSVGKVRVGVSIGIALFPMDSDGVEPLVRLADKAHVSLQRQRQKYLYLCSRIAGIKVGEV